MIPDAGVSAFWVMIVSLLSVAVSWTITLLFIILSPKDVFSERRRSRPITLHRRLLRICVALLGWCLVFLGLVLSVPGIPGQGFLTVLMGLLLVDFPGRDGVLRRIVGRPGVRNGLDRVRRKFGKPPFAW